MIKGAASVSGGSRMNDQVQLRFGALSPSIQGQLEEQSVAYDPEQVAQWEEWSSAIVSMTILGVITGAERQRIHKRLFKRILEKLEEHARADAA